MLFGCPGVHQVFSFFFFINYFLILNLGNRLIPLFFFQKKKKRLLLIFISINFCAVKVLYPRYRMASFKLAHLEPDECEYELCIRGLPTQLTRIRLSNLADILESEALGTMQAPDKCCNKDFVSEVNHCFRKLEELEKLLITLANYSQPDFKPHQKLLSRLNHLLIRLGRIKNSSSDSRILMQLSGLTGKCQKYISFLNDSMGGEVLLSELLKGEKLISQMSFLGISSSTEEALPPKGAASPIRGECSFDLMAGEEISPTSILQREKLASQKGPASDAGEDRSDYISMLEKDIIGLLGSQGREGGLPKQNYSDPIVPSKGSGAIKKNPFFFSTQPKPNSVVPELLRRNAEPKRTVSFPNPPNLVLSPIRRSRYPEYSQKSPPRQSIREPVRRQARDQNIFPEPNQEEVRRFNPPDFGRLPRSNYRNPVPNWHLVFTGDGKGLSVIDFIKQVYYMARADRVSDEELVASAIHLFSGPARSWYMSVERSIETWEQLCGYLYTDFTSQDGDFGLMKDLEQRHQGSGEPFVVYLAAMVNIFDQLVEPLSEAKKIDMVTRNMLPYLIERLALIDIIDLGHLSRTCKKIEDAKSKIRGYRSVPSVESPRREPRRPMYELEAAPLIKAYNVENFCWNCREPGHFFKLCRQPKMRVFCYFCGELGQLARQCSSCRESGNQDGRSYRPYERDGQYR